MASEAKTEKANPSSSLPEFAGKIAARSDTVPTILLMISIAISTCGTAAGLIKLIGVGANRSPELLQVVLVTLLALAIAVASWFVLDLSVRGKTAISKLALVIYAPLAIWSLAFGFAFWWDILAAPTQNRMNIEAAIFDASVELDRIEAEGRSINYSLSYVSDSLAARASEELAAGGICGPATISGRGPAQRELDSAVYSVRELEQRQQNSLAQIVSRRDAFRKSGFDLLDSIPTLESGQLQRQIVEFQRSHIDELRLAVTTLSFERELVGVQILDVSQRLSSPSALCPQPDITQKLDEISAVLNTPIEYQSRDIAAVVGDKSVEAAFVRLGGTLTPGSPRNLQSAAPQRLSGWRDFAALATAFLVELMIAFFTMVRRSALSAETADLGQRTIDAGNATPTRPANQSHRPTALDSDATLTPTSIVDVFVSYKRRKRGDVAKISAELSKLKISVWFDARLEPGTPFHGEIAREVRAAKCVLVCWTPDALASGGDTRGWVLAEANIGRDRGVYVPAAIEPTPLDPPFNLDHVEDLSAWLAGDTDVIALSAWNKTLDAIGRKLKREGLGSLATIIDGEDPEALEAWAYRYPNDPMANDALERADMLRKERREARMKSLRDGGESGN